MFQSSSNDENAAAVSMPVPPARTAADSAGAAAPGGAGAAINNVVGAGSGGRAGATGLVGGSTFAPTNTFTGAPAQSYNNTAAEPISAAAAASTYEEIAWQISVDGTAIKRLLSFELTQRMGAHHSFELRLYHTELEDPRTYRIDKTKSLLGKNLTAVLGTHINTDVTRFSGIITEVAFEEKTGLYGEIILRGSSPTILLEGGPHLHSFYNKNLQGIVNETLQAAGGKLESQVAPKFGDNIEYTVQHVESHFEFLIRMAQLHGEWAYYDGEKFHFGRPSNQPERTLQYARHLQSLRMVMAAKAMNFEGIGYRATDDQRLKKTPPSQVTGLNFYGDTAVQSSDGMYATPVRHYPRLHATDQGALDRITKVAKAAKAAETFSVEGVSRHPAPQPGLRLTVMMGDSEMGAYLVTEAVHRLDNVKNYSCTFKALASDVEVLPVPAEDLLTLPHTEAQIATVKDNADPAGQGRVRAQFLWQSGDNMTPWMRVSTPDAGGGGEKVAKNRGFVFVPEVGDQVIVGFENGNPDAPFVLGSLFHGKHGSGGGSGNKNKSVQTRSGISLMLDDDNGSASLSDPSGNVVTLNGDGTITISAPTSILMKAGDKIDIASKEINILAATKFNITGDGGPSSEGTIQALKFTTTAATEATVTTAKLMLSGTTEATLGGATVKVAGGTTVITGNPVNVNP